MSIQSRSRGTRGRRRERQHPATATPERLEALRGRLASSFNRVSSDRQEDRGGFPRQRKACAEVVARYGLVLVGEHEHVGSAWKGAHHEDSVLGELIGMRVEGRRIEPGSVLIVEAIHRLTRERTMRGIDTIRRIIDAGWVVITAENMQIWDAETINGPHAFLLVALIQTANTVCENLSIFVSDAWDEKRKALFEKGVPMSHHCPGWMRVVPKDEKVAEATLEECTFRKEAVPVDTLVRMWTLRAAGDSFGSIAKTLRAEKRPTIGRSVEDKRPGDRAWRPSRVAKLLEDRRVLGELTLEMLDGTKLTGRPYPQVIGDDLWNDAKKVARAREDQTGAVGRDVANLFTKLARCRCGATLTVRTGGRPRPDTVTRRTNRNRHWWHVLTCSEAAENRGDCRRRDRYRLRDWEPRFLDAVLLSPPPMPAGTAAGSEAEARRARLAAMEV